MKKLLIGCVTLSLLANVIGGVFTPPQIVAAETVSLTKQTRKMISPMTELTDTKEIETFVKGKVKFPEVLSNQMKRQTLQKIASKDLLIYEVNYTGETNRVSLRIADKTAGEISGDYRDKPVVKKFKVDGKKVTVKGTKAGILNVKWQRAGKQFVLIADRPLTKQAVKKLVAAF